MQKSQLLWRTHALPRGHVFYFHSPSLGLKHVFDAFKVQAPPTLKSHQGSAGTRPSGSFHIGLHEATTIALRLSVSQASEELFPDELLDESAPETALFHDPDKQTPKQPQMLFNRGSMTDIPAV